MLMITLYNLHHMDSTLADYWRMTIRKII